MEDKMIIDLYMNRSEDAIIETSNKYGKLCKHIAYNILGNYADAEECENDTYIAIWNAIPPTIPKIFSAFLGRIVRNISLNRYEYNKASKRNNEFDVILNELEECIATKDTVESIYEAGEVAAYIDEFLETLKSETRIIFVRRYWYSDSVKEIALKMKFSEGKIKTVLFRLRN